MYKRLSNIALFIKQMYFCLNMVRIGIFASGEGTNVQRFIDYFKGRNDIKIALVVCNNPKARVLERAAMAGIPSLLLIKRAFIIAAK